MSLWQIAYRFVRNDWRRYVAFVVSASFSVMIHFLYTALAMHPELQGGYKYASYAVRGMKAATVVIVIFTFLFLLYSSTSFVRLRMKEFGLLSLLGVSRRQLIKIVLLENAIIAAVAIVSGLGAGLLLLKLFFMGVSALLRLPRELSFTASVGVWLQTIGVFGCMFAAVSLASLQSVLRRSVVELVLAGRKPKETPRFSWLRLILGLALLVAGYRWACSSDQMAILTGVVPVTALVCIATILLMREASIACLALLHRWRRYYYRPGPFLVISQLIYKVQDNYRVLAAVAILVAVILTAVGTSFSLYALYTGETERFTPAPIQLVSYGSVDVEESVAQVEKVLARRGLSDMPRTDVVAIRGKLLDGGSDVAVVPYSFYQQRRSGDRGALTLEGLSDAIAVDPTAPINIIDGESSVRQDRVRVGSGEVEVRITSESGGRLVNPAQHLWNPLIVHDQLHEHMLEMAEAEELIHISIWTGNWRSQAVQEAVEELHTLFSGSGNYISATSDEYQRQAVSMGILLFIGVFVSLVFVAACFSLVYSRLFTDIDEDRRHARRLRQVGVTDGELRRQALSQMGIILFLPFCIGLIHSTFAMRALGTLTRRTVLHYGWGGALLFLVLFVAFFFAASQLYWYTMRSGLLGDAELR